MHRLRLLSAPHDLRWRCCRAAAGHPAAIWVQQAPPSERRSWEGVRQVVAQARELLGDAAVDRVLAGDRAAAGLVLPEQPPRSRDEERERFELAARVDRPPSHDARVARPFFDRWAAILAALFVEWEPLLVIPDLGGVDEETLLLLRAFYRRRPEAFPAAFVAYEPVAHDRPPDRRGIVWGTFQAIVQSLLSDLERHPEVARVGAAEETEAGPEPPRVRPDADRLLLARLADHTTPLLPEEARLMVELVRRAFAGHAFEPALRWGLALLDRQPGLEPAAAAALHAIVGVAAYHRQCRCGGNEMLAETIERHLLSALEHETRPARRRALLDRLEGLPGREG